MNYMDTRPKTIICDIDGTLIVHNSPNIACNPNTSMVILPGTIEKFVEWDIKGYNIILLTGRKESMRQITEKQLSELGIFYDQLVMGVGGGARYLVNDCKTNGAEYAFAINLERNKGIANISI